MAQFQLVPSVIRNQERYTMMEVLGEGAYGKVLYVCDFRYRS
jgi:hypothetical protein